MTELLSMSAQGAVLILAGAGPRGGVGRGGAPPPWAGGGRARGGGKGLMVVAGGGAEDGRAGGFGGGRRRAAARRRNGEGEGRSRRDQTKMLFQDEKPPDGVMGMS